MTSRTWSKRAFSSFQAPTRCEASFSFAGSANQVPAAKINIRSDRFRYNILVSSGGGKAGGGVVEGVPEVIDGGIDGGDRVGLAMYQGRENYPRNVPRMGPGHVNFNR